MSLPQIRAAIGLLLLLNVAAPVLLSPFGVPVGGDATVMRVGYLTMGAAMVPPALLACWAALAPQPFLRRGTQALAMLASTDLALDFAMVHCSGSQSDAAEMLQITVSLVALAVCLLPLCLFRARFRWTIAPPPAAEVARPLNANQFSVRGMLLGMVFFAAMFAALRWLHPGHLDTSNLGPHLLRFAAFGLFMGLLGLPVLVLGWLVLARGGRSRLRCFFGVIGACAVAAAATAVALARSPGDSKELVFVLVGMLLFAAPSFWIIRLCGYRLVGRGRDDRPADELSAAILSPRRRFTVAVCSMILMLAAIASVLPARVELWRGKAQERRWREIGFSVALTEGQVTSLARLSDAVPAIDAAVIGHINACSRLQILALWPSEVGDETLASLGTLPQIAYLSLFGTRVTDKGLGQLLSKAPNLANLNLQATGIGDDGLLALANLERLAVLDVSHTRVTQQGIARLKLAKPYLRINSTTDDSTLSNVAILIQQQRAVLSRSPGWRPIVVRLHAASPAVTDLGVADLRGLTNIEELDFTDACLTDSAVGDLVTLSGLKKLALSGTKISNSGIALLREALPDCEIEP